MMEPTLQTTLLQVRAARAGDRVALEALFQRYLPWVVETAALRLGRRRRDLGAVEDLVQESLLDAFRAIDRFREQSEGTFRNWLATIVANNVRDRERHLRAQKRGGHRALDEYGDGDRAAAMAREATPSQAAYAHESADLVEAALLQLGERQREVIALRDRCAMSYDEVARAMGLKNAESARTTHRRALQELAVAIRARQVRA